MLTYIFMLIHSYTHAHTYLHTHGCMYTHANMCDYNAHMFPCTHTHFQTLTYLHTHGHMYTHALIFAHTHAQGFRTHTYIHTCTHVHMHLHTDTYMITCIHNHTHTHAYTHRLPSFTAQAKGWIMSLERSTSRGWCMGPSLQSPVFVPICAGVWPCTYHAMGGWTLGPEVREGPENGVDWPRGVQREGKQISHGGSDFRLG